MFVLSEMIDTVRLPPHEFHMEFHKALEKALNKKFSNKVVLNVGLCVCLYDFLKIGNSFLLPGDGASHTKVEFRFVVFRPFIDEIIVGKIRSSSPQGVQLGLEFFDDIYVPSDKLPTPSKFEDTDQMWYWEYEQEEDEPAAKLYMDPGKDVRFRVLEEQFRDTQPHTSSGTEVVESVSVEQNTENKTPYTIIASLSEPGLGCLQWWASE